MVISFVLALVSSSVWAQQGAEIFPDPKDKTVTTTICVDRVPTSREALVGADFRYPSAFIVGDISFGINSSHVHHVDLNCCPGVPGRTPPLLSLGEQLPLPPGRRRNCIRHFEMVVWTFPQPEPWLRLPAGSAIATGVGTICEFGFLQVHIRKAVDSSTANVCVNMSTLARNRPPAPSSLSLASREPSSYVQDVYFSATRFRLPCKPTAPYWRVKEGRQYAADAPAFTIFALKLHMHWRGLKMYLFRTRNNTRTLVGGGGQEWVRSQNWVYLDNTAATSKVEPGDVLEIECIYDLRNCSSPIRECNSQSCEMCWIYFQVQTPMLVTQLLMRKLNRLSHAPMVLEEYKFERLPIPTIDSPASAELSAASDAAMSDTGSTQVSQANRLDLESTTLTTTPLLVVSTLPLLALLIWRTRRQGCCGKVTQS